MRPKVSERAADGTASAARQRWLTSSIRVRAGPISARTPRTPVEIVGEVAPADLELEGAVAVRKMLLHLRQEGVTGEMEVHGAGVDLHRRPDAAEELPQGQAGELAAKSHSAMSTVAMASVEMPPWSGEVEVLPHASPTAARASRRSSPTSIPPR